jgi:hypothetical protein
MLPITVINRRASACQTVSNLGKFTAFAIMYLQMLS